MPRMRKRTTSSKKKKKKSSSNTNNNVSTSTSAQAQAQAQLPMDINSILSQADTAYESSNVESALQLYMHGQKILRQTLEHQSTSNSTNSINSTNPINSSQEHVNTIIMLSKICCKIGEIKVSFGNPNDNGYNDFKNGILLLSKSNEEQYLSQNSDHAIVNANANANALLKSQWKEARANLYMYLGQLSCEKEALENFNNAIHDLKECIQVLEQITNTANANANATIGNENEEMNNVQIMLTETKKQLCGSYCSIAELFITDLCYEPNAEQECENALKLALEIDKCLQLIEKQQIQAHNGSANAMAGLNVISTTPDAVQAMANLRLCQNRPLEAVPFILDAYSRMQVGCEAMADLVGLGKDQQKQEQEKNEGEDNMVAKELKDDALEATNKLPGFEFRCQTSKILLECAANLEQSKLETEGTIGAGGAGQQLSIEKKEEQRIYCIEAAIQTLGSLMAENDEVIETWYLLGCAFQSKSIDYHDASKHYFESALQMLMKTKEQMELQGYEIDQEMNMDEENGELNPVADVIQKIEDVKKKISEVEPNACTGMDEG